MLCRRAQTISEYMILISVIAAAVVLMALDLLFFGQVRSELRGRIPPIPPRARLLACLDGTVAEEVLMRLCALSVLAAGFRLVWRGNTAIWAAIAVSSLLFGAGHLPERDRIDQINMAGHERGKSGFGFLPGIVA